MSRLALILLASLVGCSLLSGDKSDDDDDDDDDVEDSAAPDTGAGDDTDVDTDSDTDVGTDTDVDTDSDTDVGTDTDVDTDSDTDADTDTDTDTDTDPVAVCSVSPATIRPLADIAEWDGSGSHDPMGVGIISTSWTLVPPTGSAASTSSSLATWSDFSADMAGTYEATLLVVTSDGRTGDCTTSLDVVPTDDLWIELFWTHGGDDLDLHLVKPGYGVADVTTDADCYYSNCVDHGWGGLDWGVFGDPSDDPTLELDDISGVGPEAISLGSPSSGTYSIFVHDYPGSVYAGSNPATVNVWVSGALAWTDTVDITTEDAYTGVAQVSFPAGTVTGP